MNELTQEYLKTILVFNSVTGDFVRLESAGGAKAGDIAGCRANGYVQIGVKSKLYLAHRLAFLYMTGEWPKADVDHINHIKDDNRWQNIRECTRSQNKANCGIPKTNTSGFKGVCWDDARNRWMVQIKFKGKKIYLGRYEDKCTAAMAYNTKATELFGEFSYLNDINPLG